MVKKSSSKLIDVTDEYMDQIKNTPGNVLFDEDYHFDKRHNAEVKMAYWVSNMFGCEITLLSESQIYETKNADYLWGGALWDLKSPTSNNLYDKRIKTGIKQIISNPGGLIFNFPKGNYDLAKLKRELSSCAKRSSIKSFDILIISNWKLVHAFRWE